MISIVLYGRNDNYGYNLHKRAALSLNCMAEVLSDPADEILFVDYNTPDDFPTFPEAIQDTLTDKAKRHLRILRVRPSVHARFASRTHLVALEPVARNVAVRRSNPANRWILSTNTDMIFVPRQGQSLTETVRNLPKGHYGIPRFEVPETLWESLDRRDPHAVIDAFDRWGWDLHINEIVEGFSQFLFDAPGDFQLMERDDLFALHGFHEGMLLGWHVDSNIAKRVSLVHGPVKDLSQQFFGYHCDHTRQVTPMHRRDAVENSMDEFFHQVVRPDIPSQADSWGCADAEIEEIRLNQGVGGAYLSALRSVLTSPLKSPLRSAYIPETYDQCGYSPEHLLPFLLDLFAGAPRHWSVAWLGSDGRIFDLFRDAWFRMGFEAPILVPDDFPGRPAADGHVRHVPLNDLKLDAKAFVFNFAHGDGTPLAPEVNDNDGAIARALAGCFFDLLSDEEGCLVRAQMPRRFIGVNAIHNRFDNLFRSHINVARTPFSVRIRHGFVFPPNKDGVDWLKQMLPGSAGLREGAIIRSQANIAGHMAYGPYVHPFPGQYRLTIDIECGSATNGTQPDINIEIVMDNQILAERRLTGDAVVTTSHDLTFEITRDLLERVMQGGVEARIYSNGAKDLRLVGVMARREFQVVERSRPVS